MIVEGRLCVDETGAYVRSSIRTRSSRTFDGWVMCRPFGVHILQLFECFNRLLDCASEGGAVLVVKELMYMAGKCLSLDISYGLLVCCSFCVQCTIYGTHTVLRAQATPV